MPVSCAFRSDRCLLGVRSWPDCGANFFKFFVPSEAGPPLRTLAGQLMKELRMKKLLVMSLLAFATCGFAQDSQSAQPGQTTSGQQTGAQPQQKTIKDPAE